MSSQSAAAAVFTDAFIDFTGGTIGGAAGVLVGQPLDTVKVKLQTYPNLYRSSYNCFVQTFRSDGVRRGLYRGTVPNLVANVAENSVLFCAYGACQTVVANAAGKRVSDLDATHNASAGFLAAFFSSLALCPTELIKCRMQTLSENMKSNSPGLHSNITPYHLTRNILREEGLPGLFKGLTSTWLREMPGYFVFFGAYEYYRSLLCKPGQCKDDIGVLRTAAAGGAGGVFFWLAVYPADMIKSRIQVLSHHGSSMTFTQLFRQVLTTEGVAAMYLGIVPTLIRTVPATGILFVTYEATKKLLGSLLNTV